MSRSLLAILSGMLIAVAVFPQRQSTVVVDSISSLPLSGVSVLDRRGNHIGMTSPEGNLPRIARDAYPVTLRLTGYKSYEIWHFRADTVRLAESIVELPEVIVNTRKREVLHLLGYVREYSTLTTYSDTIFLFREKTVDFMVPSAKVKRFKGWLLPRILASESYYRFTDVCGVDSVSDRFDQHFSWSDWVSIIDHMPVSDLIRYNAVATDTIFGKYSPASVWRKNDDDLRVEVNMLSDSINRCWVPGLAEYIYGHNKNVEFNTFRINYTFKGFDNSLLGADALTGMAFTIESTGRARRLFRVFPSDRQFFVNTYAELYIIDREYISVSEARTWENHPPSHGEVGIYPPPEAPQLQPYVRELISKVNSIDHTQRHLATPLDKKVAGIDLDKKREKNGILRFLKTLLK